MSSSRSDAARGARNQLTSEDEGKLPVQQRFTSPQSLPSGSWESQASFDEGEEGTAIIRQPHSSSSSRPPSSSRDRRKFDTTTPTLVDEDDEPEMLFRRFSPSASKQSEESMRRTPGAAMYKSMYELEEGTAAIRLVDQAPGRSSSQGGEGGPSLHSFSESSVSYSPSHSKRRDRQREGSDRNERQKGIWETFSSESGTPSPTHRSRDHIQPSRPPLAPGSVTTTSSGRTSVTRTGLFSSAAWARGGGNNAPSTGVEEGGRPQGTFSPNMLRLTENIGNILHEEDDDFAVDVPTVGDTSGESGEGLSRFGGGDWSGSYVFSQGRRGSPKTVVGSRAVRQEGRSRRHTGQDQGERHGNAHVPHPSKPLARRVPNESPQFGQGQTQAFAPAAPGQVLQFGGAFEPPKDQHSQFRSVQSGSASPGPQQQHPGLFNMPISGPTPVAQFGTYLPAPGHFSHPLSDMHASAREFVPMAATPTPPPPQFSAGPGWLQHDAPTQPQPTPTAQDPGWSTYGYAPGPPYSIHQQLGDTRGALTPSPGLAGPWAVAHSQKNPSHPQDLYHSIEKEPPVASSTLRDTPNSLDQGSLDTRFSRKDSKRGKRGKKKGKSTKKGKDSSSSRPGSSFQESEEANASGYDSALDPKRADLEESPSDKLAYKEFLKAFRNAEKLSSQNAEQYALEALQNTSLPESIHWRIYIELADLTKRSNRYAEARALYQRVCELQPYANQGWLEYSKLEEECGHMNRVTNILHSGLEYCVYSESLLTRAVKHQEKMGNIDSARKLLARLQHVGIDKVWKTVLEGALLEARAGNSSMSRRVLKYLMHHIPWYGPLYLEAYKLERDLGHPLDALQIVEQGLQAIPRYGPLWFGAFRLCEELDMAQGYFTLPQTMGIIARATMNISKELVWKVHLEAALMLERSALEQGKTGVPINGALEPARHRFSLTVLTCPNNLRWKVWLATARMELSVGNFDVARVLFARAHKVVPDKGRSATLLDCARLEEFVGEIDLARAILGKGRVIYTNDWKVWLESVLLEIRSGNKSRAIEIASAALCLHKGTGRLWAALVQLTQFQGRDKAQHQALRRALNAVPKSGEVWCEGARIHLNPFSDTFDPVRARRHLCFATKFTPQYGDSFIEFLRLEMLEQWLQPVADLIWTRTRGSVYLGGPDEPDHLIKYISDVHLLVLIASDNHSSKTPPHTPIAYAHLVPLVQEKLNAFRSLVDLTSLRLACSNADPNYGSVWFACRRVPTDTPRRVIEDAAREVVMQIHRFAHLYVVAMLRRLALSAGFMDEKPASLERRPEDCSAETAEWEDRVDRALVAGPSLHRILTDSGRLDNMEDGSDFVNALSALRKNRPVLETPLADRRKILFGTDALFT